MNSLSPTTTQGEFPPAPIVVSAAIPSVGSERTELSEESDAEQRPESRLLRRLRYALRYLYWTCKHRSTANAAWVCEYEGFKW